MATYEVRLTRTAERIVLGMSKAAIDEMIGCLREELESGRNAGNSSVVPFDDRSYRATPLSNGYVAVHRLDEKPRLFRLGRPRVYVVFDIISPEAAISARIRGRSSTELSPDPGPTDVQPPTAEQPPSEPPRNIDVSRADPPRRVDVDSGQGADVASESEDPRSPAAEAE